MDTELPDRRKKITSENEKAELDRQSELRTSQGEHKRRIASERSSWKLESTEDGISIYQTPSGRYASYLDKNGKPRLTLIIGESFKIEK